MHVVHRSILFIQLLDKEKLQSSADALRCCTEFEICQTQQHSRHNTTLAMMESGNQFEPELHSSGRAGARIATLFLQ